MSGVCKLLLAPSSKNEVPGTLVLLAMHPLHSSCCSSVPNVLHAEIMLEMERTPYPIAFREVPHFKARMLRQHSLALCSPAF